ncbi:MAG: biotin--[acetyl-CoA-carboxylase] ligase, partial [Candidatus Thermoplasmatota archaeon]|nr:biotin--[acetyl-CoA-carboxylase] ligase [Candidatus Thermoplasmatota archaeon]MBU1941064.1 biotin--[acetyl-CoA-carboxylase] ligase [Candidatus Thermoplasmatota archaeon]
MTIRFNEHNINSILLAEYFLFFHHFKVFDKVSSTNFEAKEYIKHNKSLPCIFLANQQSQGRGRFDRRWYSPPGGLYMSCIIKPPTAAHHQTLFPLIFAVAVAETLQQNELPSMIRWPNDILIQSKKIAGILLETIPDGSGNVYVIGGIGINVNNDVWNCTSDFRTPPTSVKQERGQEMEYAAFLLQL